MFFPCKLGEFTLYLSGMQTKGIYFEAALNFFVGYIGILFSVVVGHQLMKLLRVKEYVFIFSITVL